MLIIFAKKFLSNYNIAELINLIKNLSKNYLALYENLNLYILNILNNIL